MCIQFTDVLVMLCQIHQVTANTVLMFSMWARPFPDDFKSGCFTIATVWTTTLPLRDITITIILRISCVDEMRRKTNIVFMINDRSISTNLNISPFLSLTIDHWWYLFCSNYSSLCQWARGKYFPTNPSLNDICFLWDQGPHSIW